MEVRRDRPPVPQDRPFTLERALDDGYRPGRKLRRGGAAGESVFERVGSNETLVQADVERFSADRALNCTSDAVHYYRLTLTAARDGGGVMAAGARCRMGLLTVCGTRTKFNYCLYKIVSYLQIVAS